MSLVAMCRSQITLKRPTHSKDASGGDVKTFAAVSGYSGVACDIQPASGRVRDQYMQKQLNVTHTVYFPVDTPVRAGDQLVYSDPILSQDRIFQFQGLRPVAPGYVQWACIVDVEEQFG